MIPTFGDEPLTNTVSMLCPRFFATTPRRLLLGKGGPLEFFFIGEGKASRQQHYGVLKRRIEKVKAVTLVML